MKISDILHKVPFTYTVHGANTAEVSSLSINSKNITKDSCFFAISGGTVNGHDYIDTAISAGANCIVCEVLPDELMPGVMYILVDDTHSVVGPMAGNFYGNPSHKMKVIGVTGTNGKTTVATSLYSALHNFHRKSALISTVENIIDGNIIESTHTTPDAVTLQSLLRRSLDAGCEYVVMEVSSHSVVQHRIDGIHFTGAIFTNLSHDHLDYHHTIEAYANAKKKFFDNLPSSAFAITNVDDAYGRSMVADTMATVFTYGFGNIADYSEIIDSVLIGQFNQYNILAVYSALIQLGFESDHIKKIIKTIEAPRGRFELCVNSGGVRAIVDYAHTPDGVQNVLEAARGIASDGRIITVLGCGGDRDKEKRPIMARTAYDLSDVLILTSDNPRNEDPNQILIEMQAGLPEALEKEVKIIVDRQEAIMFAKNTAKESDIIMVLGKGHETYQEIAGVREHFDDKEELIKAFA